MSLVAYVVMNGYSIAVLLAIYHHAAKRHQRDSEAHRIYMLGLQFTILLLVVDALGRFDGRPDTIYPILSQTGCFLLYLLSPTLPVFWFAYAYVQIFGDRPCPRRLLWPFVVANIANALLTVATLHNGWYYSIDVNNIYHRGPLFPLHCALPAVQLLITSVMIVANCRRIDRRYLFSLLFFAVPPCIGVILQVMFYGAPLVLSGVTVSLLVVFLNIQNKSIHTDYLTGVDNRTRLESYLGERVATSAADRTFSAILVDLDSFKSINDTFGHDAGDRALQISAQLLKSCIRSDDLIARFGGDEFCIVLRNAGRADLNAIVQRINAGLEKYNATSDQQYKLGFTMGYDVYDTSSHMTAEEFQKRIDTLMYENKRHALSAGG